MKRRWKFGSAPLGTPENPEIIEPGQTEPLRRASAPSRFARVAQTLWWMVSISIPAAFALSVCYWVFDAAINGSAISWLLLIFIGPPTLLLFAFALLADLALTVLLVLHVLGKPIDVRPGAIRFLRFR